MGNLGLTIETHRCATVTLDRSARMTEGATLTADPVRATVTPSEYQGMVDAK
jgi:hypothetical protein